MQAKLSRIQLALTDELMTKILSKLSPQDLAAASMVCRHWNRVAHVRSDPMSHYLLCLCNAVLHGRGATCGHLVFTAACQPCHSTHHACCPLCTMSAAYR